MVEGTPGKPYGDLFACFNVVEANMRARYVTLHTSLRHVRHVRHYVVYVTTPCTSLRRVNHPALRSNLICHSAFIDELLFAYFIGYYAVIIYTVTGCKSVT